jgi:hypothetical protein
MAGLPGSPRIRDSAEGAGEGFVVGKNGKPPPFQHMTEMADPQRASQKLSIKGRVLGLGWLQFLGEKPKRLPVDRTRAALMQAGPDMHRRSIHREAQDSSRQRMGQVSSRSQRLLGSCECCLHLSGPLHRVGPLPVASQGVRQWLQGVGHRRKKTAVEAEEAQEPLQLLDRVGGGKSSEAYVGSGVTPPAVTLWPKKSIEGGPKYTFLRVDDQAVMTKAKKNLPEMKTVLDVIFAGHLQIILVGEAELQLVLHPVDLPLKSVAGVPQA